MMVRERGDEMITEATEKQRILEAYQLVRDLFTPDPSRYWLDLVLSGSIGWFATAIALLRDDWLTSIIAVLVAAVAWHRATLMVHELTHQRRGELPGFHLAWNLVIGVAWLFPSVMYERVHNGHHRKSTYGTAFDPEYLPLAGRPLAVLGYFMMAFLIFPLLFLRFIALTPLAWILPPMRRFLNRHGSSYAINPWFTRSMTSDEVRNMVRWEMILFAVWGSAIILTLVGVFSWRWLIIWYVVHTTATILNKVRMISAHHFASDGHPTDHLGQFHDSVDTPGRWWTEFWAPLGLRYHALHHMFPTLPFHNLHIAYSRLTCNSPTGMPYPPGNGRGFLTTFRRLLVAKPATQADRTGQ